ncbi:hypothetical protein ACFL2C_01155 [Patescibacteria group bacterium]
MKNKQAGVLIVLLVVFIGMFIWFAFDTRRSYEIEPQQAEIDETENYDNGELSRYFDNYESAATGVGVSQNRCMINGEIVEDGVSNSNTVCVIAPPKK